jgi:6-phosphofructokinase 2
VSGPAASTKPNQVLPVEKSMKPIVTLTLNPSIDAAATAQAVRPTRKVRTSAERYDPGGGGINVARVINELGGQSLAVYMAGGLTGGVLDDMVKQAGVRQWTVPIGGLTRVSHIVHELSTGNEFRFTPEGPEIREEEWRACLEQLAMLDFGHLVASGSLPRGVPEDFYRRVAEIASTKRARFVLDTSGPALKAALGHGVHLAKPSLGELEAVTGRELRDPEALRSAAEGLVRSGAAEILAVTMGHEGALLVTPAGVRRLRAPRVEVRSAVGAGDSFVAAMTLALAQGRPPEEAFTLGVAAGTATVTTMGTELCRRADVERLYRRILDEGRDA